MEATLLEAANVEAAVLAAAAAAEAASSVGAAARPMRPWRRRSCVELRLLVAEDRQGVDLARVGRSAAAAAR